MVYFYGSQDNHDSDGGADRFMHEGGHRDENRLAALARIGKMFYMPEYGDGAGCKDIHGDNRLGGNAVVDAVVFGKLAADIPKAAIFQSCHSL